MVHSTYKWIAFIPFNQIDNVVIDCKELRLWLGFFWSIWLSLQAVLWPAQTSDQCRKVVIAYTLIVLVVTWSFTENWVIPVVLFHTSSYTFLSQTSNSTFLSHASAFSSNSPVSKMPPVSKQKAHLKAIRKRKRRFISTCYLILLLADLSQAHRVPVLAWAGPVGIWNWSLNLRLSTRM